MKLKKEILYIAVFTTFMVISYSSFYMIKSQSVNPIVYDVIVDQDIAYVSYGSAGLHIVDVSDKSDPFLISEYDYYGECVDTFLLNKQIFALFSDNSLRIIDISKIKNPTLIGYVTLNYPTYNVVVDNDLAYVAAGEYGLKIINVTDTSSPSVIETYDSIGEVKDVKIEHDLIYLADGSNGFLVLDNSNPLNPTLISTLDTGYCENIFVGDYFIYLACGSDGLEIVDVTDSSNPYSVGSYGTSNEILSVFVEFNDLAYIANGVGGLEIVDVGTPTLNILLGHLETISITRNVFVSDYYAYVANTQELLIVDVSLSISPTTKGSYTFETGTRTSPHISLDTQTILLIIISTVSGIAFIVFLAKLGPFIRMIEDTGPFSNSLAISLFLSISGLFLWLSNNAFVNGNESLMYGLMFISPLLGGLICGIFAFKEDWAAVTLPLALLLGISVFCILILPFSLLFIKSFFTSIGILLTTLISSAIGRAIIQVIREEKKEKPILPTVGDIRCSKCGEIIPSSSKFCYNCGFTIEN